MVSSGRVVLKKNRDESVRRFHPWVFSGAIDHIEGSLIDGDIVDLYDFKGMYLGTGHASTGSIAVKVFWYGPEKPSDDIWYKKINRAYKLRELLLFINNPESNAYRLVFSEADGLPGLVIDYYNGVLVLQTHSLGMHLQRDKIVEALVKLYGERLIAVYDKSSSVLAKSGAASDGDKFLLGSIEEVIVNENGRKFYIDFLEGQKTGFFLDQRDNRALLGQYSAGKKVLNVFCYTGGFSIYSLTGQARHVTSVDSSRRAITMLEKNLKLNHGYDGKHESIVADAKLWLPTMADDYEIIILDPPAFAKRQSDKHRGLQGYKFINKIALSKIKKGGLLFTFSCSQAISKEQFTSILMAAAIEAKRQVKIVHHLGHSADHPVSLYHPEGEYLKGLVLEVE
jgi:23S rRNA (cytosine1962-C5)-methyltransferase